MFKKQGVCVATAAGMGMRSTIRDMADSLFFWGVARIERLGLGVAATRWDEVSDKKKAVIEKRTSAIAGRIRARSGRVRPGLRTKGLFAVMRLVQRKGWNARDTRHWREQGWLGGARPWKQT